MLCKAKAVLSQGPKELEGNRIRASDLSRPKGYTIRHHAEGVLKGMGVHHSLFSGLEGPAGHWLMGDGQLFVHHFLKTFIYICVCVYI